jgi:hypothetical protein
MCRRTRLARQRLSLSPVPTGEVVRGTSSGVAEVRDAEGRRPSRIVASGPNSPLLTRSFHRQPVFAVMHNTAPARVLPLPSSSEMKIAAGEAGQVDVLQGHRIVGINSQYRVDPDLLGVSHRGSKIGEQ